MKSPKLRPERVCSICGCLPQDATPYQDGVICEVCSDTTRSGRDNTSRALKTRQRADRLRIDQMEANPTHFAPAEQEYAIHSGDLMASVLSETVPAVAKGSGNEAVNPKVAGLVNTLTNPRVAALEASSHRTDLLTMLGNDIAAMALDAADTIQATNSLEKMLAHQLAAIHQASMQMIHRANLMQDPVLAAKTLTAAMKGCAAYQGGLGALRQLRGNQQQHIVVQHVNVNDGGQAVVANVSGQGRAGK